MARRIGYALTAFGFKTVGNASRRTTFSAARPAPFQVSNAYPAFGKKSNADFNPGKAMRFLGFPDPADRRKVIAYLKHRSKRR